MLACQTFLTDFLRVFDHPLQQEEASKPLISLCQGRIQFQNTPFTSGSRQRSPGGRRRPYKILLFTLWIIKSRIIWLPAKTPETLMIWSTNYLHQWSRSVKTRWMEWQIPMVPNIQVQVSSTSSSSKLAKFFFFLHQNRAQNLDHCSLIIPDLLLKRSRDIWQLMSVYIVVR